MNTEDYLLLLLADSNLPTGAFVASAGLESYLKHGFSSINSFMQDSLAAYARSALPFVSDAHRVMVSSVETIDKFSETRMQQTLDDLQKLDELYETMTLNHVARRASKSQGVALLTLYSRSFASPTPTPSQKVFANIVDKYKTMVRRGDAPGHLPICWGILSGTLCLTLDRSQYLHLFLHVRGLLSAAVRLNKIGPYHSQHLLLHYAKSWIDIECKKCEALQTGLSGNPKGASEQDFQETVHGPANTWPLGEILAARHDLQHSRIFNS